MSQPDSHQGGDHVSLASISSTGQALSPDQKHLTVVNGHQDTVNRDIARSHPGVDYSPVGGKRGADDENTRTMTSEGYLQNPGSVAEESIASQQNMFKANDSATNTDASETLTNHSDAAAPSHDLSYSSSSSDHAQASYSTQTGSDTHAKPQEEYPQQEQNPDEPPAGMATLPIQPRQTAIEENRSSISASNQPIDIQALVDTITANAAKEDANQGPAPKAVGTAPGTPSNSLPPRPPVPQQPSQAYVPVEDARAYQPNFAPAIPAPATLPSTFSLAPGSTYAAGAPGTVSNSHGALPPPPSAAVNAPPMTQYPSYPTFTGAQPPATTASQQWESFVQDERKYVSEARWDKFPEGSRLFIGNLSSERASKKEVFDIFAPYGNLAQISLKQAYGFVQYHTAAEGEAALDSLQGIDIKGRKVHLEISRPQKKDGNGDKQRGNKRDRRDSDRHDGGRGKRDDHRPTRQPSPRRNGHRQQNSYSNDHSYHDRRNSRHGRSRSPLHHGRRDSGGYRQRSPSPYYSYPSEAELEIPRRYGANVPDVQFLLLHEVSRDFISWVEGAFVAAGLRVEVMFLNPRFPQHAVIQRQVVEGVHAVAELTFQAQQTSKIPLQVFDRSAGRDKVRFDQYQDLDPSIAAQLVVRAKGALATTPPYGSHPTYNHHPAYNGQPLYNSQPAYGSYPAYPPPYAQPTQPSHIPPPYNNTPYIPANVQTGPNDNAYALQQIMGSVPNQQPPTTHAMPPHPGTPAGMNTYMASYGASQPPPHGARSASSGESAQHVQNIMAQLSRYRQ
ncbi:nuclear polyadenylated RNA-binding protein 3 [Diatrype stigma]|uniref:Nuclear polyadenylated RNA-binding protein 3 n=1 Tax=Diatrype stigma TaxID=117547 RepID=A0AAN9UYC0_9PEZI